MQGQTQWIKSFPKTNGSIKSSDGNSVFQTADGGYIIGTSIYWTVSFFGQKSNIMLIKTDNAGNLLWSKTYPGVGTSSALCVKQTSDLGYIVCGTTLDTIQQLNKTYLLKTDISGNPQWGKTYAESVGINGNAFCVNQTSDGGFIVTGDSYSGTFVIKTDNTGTIVWDSNFGIVGDGLRSVIQTSDGGYLAAGFNYLNNDLNATLSKLSANGTIQWQKIYSSTSTSSFDEGFAVEEVPGGYLLLENTGYTASALIKTDLAGNVLWSVIYSEGSTVHATALDKTTDGGYAFTSLWSDYYMIGVYKTDSLGFINCNDSMLTVQDSIYTPSFHPGFITGSGSPSQNHSLVFTTEFLNDSIFCLTGKPDAILDIGVQNSVYVFPNPSSGNFILEINSLKGNSVRIEVYDVLGQLVMEKEESANEKMQVNLDLSAMINGIYFVSVKVDGQVLTTKKIVKEN